jgi:hypothetical protein
VAIGSTGDDVGMAAAGGRPGGKDYGVHVLADGSALTGVWANDTEVVVSEHEITVDCFRVDFGDQRPTPRAVLVARVAMSPIAAGRLVDKLERCLLLYTQSEIDREVPGDGEAQDPADS